uniref:Ankyrin repeat domain-containing protein 46-like n=1 Tax=Sinocyclocheilus grahami TaxID=75366 RepID=A0A672T5A2_SINGR
MSYVFINDSLQTSVPLLQACIDGDLSFARRLLEAGCDPNIRDHRGRTGLHLAAARGNVDICRFLHKFGADLLATDYQGNTALHLCGHVDTIQFLVSNGLKIDICNHNGSTPLVLAKRRGVNKDAIRLLEGLEEQEVKGFNRGTHSKLEAMQMAESERLELHIFTCFSYLTRFMLAKRRGVNKDAIRLLEGLEEQEVKGFNRGTHSKLEAMQMAESERLELHIFTCFSYLTRFGTFFSQQNTLVPSAMESHSLLNPNLQNSEGVLFSFRSTWQEFVEDLGFWRVLLLLVVISLLSLGIAYYVSGVLPFSASQLELVH